jgi:hypothetical protein
MDEKETLRVFFELVSFLSPPDGPSLALLSNNHR